MLLTVGFLSLGLGEEWLARFLQGRVINRWLMALAIMLVVGVAYTVAAEIVAPRLHRQIKKIHGAVKPGRGELAGIAGALILFGLVYLGYYFTYGRRG